MNRADAKLITELEAIPLADMTEADQRTFWHAVAELRRLYDRVHMLEIKLHQSAAQQQEPQG